MNREKQVHRSGTIAILKKFQALWSRLWARETREIDPTTVDSAYGIRLVENWDDWTFKFYVRGSYGFVFSDFLHALNADFVFIDIGANQGLYSIIAAKNTHCKKAYAFEPVEEISALLSKNAKVNDCQNLEVIQAAISDISGLAEIEIRDGHSGAASMRKNPQKGQNQKIRTQRVQTVNSKEVSGIIDIAARRIVVKIDVEGHEEVVIRELMKCGFFECISDIFYECDENWVSAENLQTMLKSKGFVKFEKIGDGTHYDVHASKPPSSGLGV